MIPICVQLSVGGSSMSALLDAAQQYEDSEVDSIWIGSHLIDHYDATRAVPECVVTLSALATVTRRIGLGSLVIPALYLSPPILAKVAGTLDELSAGRFQLGIGAGGTKAEYVRLGLDFPGRAARVARLTETLQVLRRLQLGQLPPETAAGDATAVEIAPSFARTPLTVAALGTVTARLAGKFADEVNTIDYATMDAAKVITTARAAAERAGRAVRVSLMVPPPTEVSIGGGAHPEAGIERAVALGADRIVYRVVPPYPNPAELLEAVRS